MATDGASAPLPAREDLPQPAGVVRVVTNEPIAVPVDANSPSALWRSWLSERPWIAPVALLGAAAAYLLLRRR